MPTTRGLWSLCKRAPKDRGLLFAKKCNTHTAAGRDRPPTLTLDASARLSICCLETLPACGAFRPMDALCGRGPCCWCLALCLLGFWFSGSIADDLPLAKPAVSISCCARRGASLRSFSLRLHFTFYFGVKKIMYVTSTVVCLCSISAHGPQRVRKFPQPLSSFVCACISSTKGVLSFDD